MSDPCKVDGCNWPRVGATAWCRDHNGQLDRRSFDRGLGAALTALGFDVAIESPDPTWPRFGLFWPWTRKARRG